MKTMSTIVVSLLSRFVPQPAVDPSMTDEAIEARRAKLRKRQHDMYQQMIKDGTHLFKKGKWARGDSVILREAGLVK